MPRVARKSLHAPWLHLLLVLLLLGRALVPVGYMPGQGGLALCPAYGASMALDGTDRARMAGMADMPGMDMSAHGANGGHAGGHADHGMRHEASCSYATAAMAASLAGGHSLPPLAWVSAAPPDATPPAEPPILRGTIAPSRLPRGPPDYS